MRARPSCLTMPSVQPLKNGTYKTLHSHRPRHTKDAALNLDTAYRCSPLITKQEAAKRVQITALKSIKKVKENYVMVKYSNSIEMYKIKNCLIFKMKSVHATRSIARFCLIFSLKFISSQQTNTHKREALG